MVKTLYEVEATATVTQYYSVWADNDQHAADLVRSGVYDTLLGEEVIDIDITEVTEDFSQEEYEDEWDEPFED